MTSLPGHHSARARLRTAGRILALLVLAAPCNAAAQEAATPSPADTAASEPLSPEQLQSLVAPIALYSDALLAQTLVASTYPLEIMQLYQWLEKHPDLEDQALADSVAAQPWDPAIQSMAAVPDAVKRLAEDIQWTTELGNAFLAQQSDVMDAVQVMRGKAQENGALESNEQHTVSTQAVEGSTVIVIEPTNPEVIYVPSYNPTVVYPPPIYPYPPIYYPPYYPGQAFLSFSFGFAMGAAIWGGSCCYAGWGGNNVYINHNNNFNRNVDRERNVDRGDRNRVNTGDRNRGQGGRGDSWQHNPSHRGGTPYGDRATAERFGGADRAAARDARGQRAGAGGAGVSNRAGVGNRASGGAAGNRAGGAAATNRAAGAGVSNRSTGSRSSQSIGGRNIPSGGQSSAFGGGSRGYSGQAARASSARGRSSFSGSRGGGGMRGGGGRRR